MAKKLPLPIPYQGSKRMLAPMIYPLLPSDVVSFYEPFAGSAAMTLFVAHHGVTKRYVLGDTLEPIVDLWASIIEQTSKTAKRYSQVWHGQTTTSTDYFNRVRERYNNEKDP
ncbi:MAG TPA: DNA adenine methylase, partial [Xylella fastidiosa subsp. pauca]